MVFIFTSQKNAKCKCYAILHIHRSYILCNKEPQRIKPGIIHLVRTQSFPKKLTFPTSWYEHVRVRIKG